MLAPAVPRLALALAAVAACGAPQRARPTTGAITGIARDQASGDPIAKAQIVIDGERAPRRIMTTSSDRGLYAFDRLAPGRYRLRAAFAGQPLEIVNIDVRAGTTTNIDLVFTIERPAPIRADFASPAAPPGAELAR